MHPNFCGAELHIDWEGISGGTVRDLAPYIVFSALNVAQRPQHRFLAKLWHKNDVFDEKKRYLGVLNLAQHRPETARLTSPREF